MSNITNLIGMLWAILSIASVFVLLRKNMMSKYIGIGFLTISTILGFLIFSLMIPLQFQNLISSGPTGKGPMLLLPIVGFLLIILLSAFLGRIFCGYSCPIGAVQELLYMIPLPKIKKGSKWLFMGIRWAFLLAMIIAGVLSGISLVNYFGAGSFFGLDIGSWTFYVFTALLLVSVFFYRPFCRLFCPIGALMSIFALIRGYRYERNDKCVDCGMCERACPTDEARANDRKMECYVCGRCDDACRFGALEYSMKRR
ncbi:MAG: 4Fe-4S binding protein [Candidatus Thermoplasmatota archaeon]|nr:4Fe-4S binding protein [Candidatus Thermoplasmatota archaeon]